MAAGRLRMRDLERATGVGREAIRFYIREGLLPEPERPARNVAWYDPSFVDRILLIRRLRQERFLPLAVIRSVLDHDAPTSEAEARTLRALDGRLAAAEDMDRPHLPEELSRLARRLGLPTREIRALGRVGLLEIVTRQGTQWLEGTSVAVAELWARLRRAGFSRDLGFDPETLTVHVQFVQWLAREELRLFAARVAGRVEAEATRHMAEEGIACVNRMLAIVRESTLLRYVAQGDVHAPQAPAAIGGEG